MNGLKKAPGHGAGHAAAHPARSHGGGEHGHGAYADHLQHRGQRRRRRSSRSGGPERRDDVRPATGDAVRHSCCACWAARTSPPRATRIFDGRSIGALAPTASAAPTPCRWKRWRAAMNGFSPAVRHRRRVAFRGYAPRTWSTAVWARPLRRSPRTCWPRSAERGRADRSTSSRRARSRCRAIRYTSHRRYAHGGLRGEPASTRSPPAPSLAELIQRGTGSIGREAGPGTGRLQRGKGFDAAADLEAASIAGECASALAEMAADLKPPCPLARRR